MILKTYVYYLRHRLINQKYNVTPEIQIFTKMKNIDRW